MSTSILLIVMGFTGTCASFGGVLLINRAQLSMIPTIAIAIVGIMIGMGWAWMMSTINSRVISNILSSASESRKNLLFRCMFGLDILLIAFGSMIAWALIPALKMIHVLV